MLSVAKHRWKWTNIFVHVTNSYNKHIPFRENILSVRKWESETEALLKIMFLCTYSGI